MAFEAEGKLYKIMDTVQITDTFRKREFVIEMVDGAYTQLIKFQMVQNNCDKLDGYNEGDDVNVTFNLRGREYTKDDKTTFFTNLDAWKIQKQSDATPQQQAAPAPAATSFPSPTDAPPMPGSNDDLPF